MIWTVGEMLAFPLLTTAVGRPRAGGHLRRRYMGLLNFSFAASFVVAPLVGPGSTSTGPRTLWLGCGVVGLLLWAGFQAVAVAIARPSWAGHRAAPQKFAGLYVDGSS